MSFIEDKDLLIDDKLKTSLATGLCSYEIEGYTKLDNDKKTISADEIKKSIISSKVEEKSFCLLVVSILSRKNFQLRELYVKVFLLQKFALLKQHSMA